MTLNEQEEIRKKSEAFAIDHGYKLSNKANAVILGLIKRKERYGKYYCPCRIVKEEDDEESEEYNEEIRKYNESIICPCVFVHDEIKEKGRCHCNLYIKG